MKWRTTAVYFMVLLMLGGVYLMIDHKQKEAARREKQARRVFAMDTATVKEIEIKSGDNKSFLLEKGDNWRISRPISSDVDKTIFSEFFSALQNIEQERKIGKASGNLGEFGLDKPALEVRVLAGSDWLELRVGGKNPAETDRYASVGQGGDVFMLSSATYNSLNKGLRDLRRKELFSWQSDQVRAVDVKWQSGEGFRLERQSGARLWKSTNKPDLEIKAKKVENLLDDLHWLRAVDFAEKDSMPSPALVEIRVQLKDGRTSDLKIANPDNKKNQAIASCSEIEDPVLLYSRFIDSIPRTVASLADRSLVSAEPADIRNITWKTENGNGNLVWMESNVWGTREGDASPKAVKNIGQVIGFLRYLEDAEYSEAVEPGANPPEEAHDSVQFVDVFGKKYSLAWEKLPAQTPDPVIVWIGKDGATREVKVKWEVVKRLSESLAHLGSTAIKK